MYYVQCSMYNVAYYVVPVALTMYFVLCVHVCTYFICTMYYVLCTMYDVRCSFIEGIEPTLVDS